MTLRLSPLTSSYFVLSLLVLLTNDFYLKYEYQNGITGKLSDVTGLFVFVYFWTVIFPRQKNIVYILTGLMFIYWKTPYSQSFIHFFSANIYTIHRTVDMSDLLALLVLPIAYFLRQHQSPGFKIATVPISLLTIFSFCATSVPHPSHTFGRPEYILFKQADLEYKGRYSGDFKLHRFDTMMVVAVIVIETEEDQALHDAYYTSKILVDLDLRVLRALSDDAAPYTSLSSYQSLRDSLTIPGTTSVTLDLDTVSDELTFRGTRLHGPFKRYSKEGKLLIEENYTNGIPDSNLGVVKRKNTILKNYLFLAAIATLVILIIIRLYRNFRASTNESLVKMPVYERVFQIILLPTIIFLIARAIASLILDLPYDMFKLIAEFVLTNFVLVPLLITIHYGIRLRSRFDLILYILLFALVLVWIEDYLFLRQILI